MNRKIGMYSSALNAVSVFGFAIFLVFSFSFGAYVASMFIAYSFVPMIGAFGALSRGEVKSAAITANVFAGIYAAFILLVYFAQLTTLRNEVLTGQAATLLDVTTFGLFFNFNLLGYGLMSLSTFFIGLTVAPISKASKVLRWLLMVHGIFAVSGFVMPITGIFYSMDTAYIIGRFVQLFLSLFFAPVGVLSYVYFKDYSPDRSVDS